MTLLKIDDKALVPPPPVIPSPPVTPTPAESGEPAPEQIWREPAGRLLARLKTKIEGLTTAEFMSRLASYGENNASDVKTVPLWHQFLVRFENPLIIILLIAAGVSAFTGGVAGFVVIVVIVMLSVVFDFVQDVRAQNAVASLRASVSVQATVRRDGKAVSVPISQLVPGDIVELVAGDLVPADSRLLEGRDLYVNQALLTGEP
jgi:Mg2+-importing ATPase